MTTAEYDMLHSVTVIKEINILKKNFSFSLDEMHTSKDLSFEFNIEDGINIENNLLSKIIDVHVLGNRKKEPLADLRILYSFSVKNVSDFVIKKDENMIVDPSLNDWLDNIVLATTRGIMYSEFRGTYVDNVILPIINTHTPHN